MPQQEFVKTLIYLGGRRKEFVFSKIQTTHRRVESVASIIQTTHRLQSFIKTHIELGDIRVKEFMGSKIQTTFHHSIQLRTQIETYYAPPRIDPALTSTEYRLDGSGLTSGQITPGSPAEARVFPGTVIVADIGFALVDEAGTAIPLRNVTITEAVNQGADWSATPRDEIDLEMLEDVKFKLSIQTQLAKYESPPLYAAGKPRTAAENANGFQYQFGGMDAATWRMTKDDISFDTFLNTDFSDILARCASYLGLQIQDAPHQIAMEEDVKNSKARDVFTRLLSILGYNYYIDSNGKIVCFPVNIKGDLNTDLLFDSFSRSVDMSQRVDSITIEKTSRIAASSQDFCFRFDSVGVHVVQFPAPLGVAIPYDRTAYGKLVAVSTYNGTPGDGGKYIQTFYFVTVDSKIKVNTPPTGAGLPATHAVVTIEPPDQVFPDYKIDAKVCFIGGPSGISSPYALADQTFRMLMGVVTNASRKAPSPWTETLWGTRAQLMLDAKKLFIEKNKGFKTVATTGPIGLLAKLTQRIRRYIENPPDYRIESFTHTLGPGTVQTSINAFIPYFPPTITFYPPTLLPPEVAPDPL